MPKTKQLHTKGKVTSIQKPCNVEDDSSSPDPEETMRQFQLELVWCIQQLERTLNEKKATEKQLQEAWKVLTVLKNNNQPIVRKRQLMRTHLGDYRAKMKAEEKKLSNMASKMKISDGPAQPKATFLRKSAFLTTGNEAFKFNFSLAKEPEDKGDKTGEPCNTEQHGNTCEIPKLNGDPTVSLDTEPNSSGDNKEVKSLSSTNFKLNFSNSDFKFNFEVNK